jgi:hypothetical protein
MTEQDKFSDSSGVPWSGRSFQESSFRSDKGEADEKLYGALIAFKTKPVNQVQIIEYFAEARVLIPLIATLGDSGLGVHGQTVDKSAELAIVSVKTPDNQNALPIFTSVSSMRTWNAAARPVPNNGRTVSFAAVAEGNSRVVLDPGSETEFVIRRPALEAIAQGFRWQLPEANPEVIEIVDQVLSALPEVVRFTLLNGDPQARLLGHELSVLIYLAASLSKGRVAELEKQFLDGISGSMRFVELVDSVGIRFLPAN